MDGWETPNYLPGGFYLCQTDVTVMSWHTQNTNKTCLHKKKSSLGNLFAEPLGTSLEYIIPKLLGYTWYADGKPKHKELSEKVARKRISYLEASHVYNTTQNTHGLQNTISSWFFLNNKWPQS